jgi:rod shape determining protein RodA
MLVYVILFGRHHQGAQRWIRVGPFELQPSEFAKLTIIFLLAFFLSEYKRMAHGLLYILVPIVIVCIPVLLIFMQPDLGTALTLMPVLLGMLIIAGARTKYLVIIVILGTLTMPVLWTQMKPYQMVRMLAFFTPTQRQLALRLMREQQKEGLRERLSENGKYTLEEALDRMGKGWNSEQSLIAVGSGGLFGRGWRSGSQTRLKLLPSAHTDFVFAVLCEEWGFMGSLLVVALYLLLIHISTRIACEAQDFFGRLLAMGIVILIVSHIIINVSMTIGLMPITGLPLPLLSYGGSSIWMIMISLGLLESIHTRRHYFKAGKYSLQS